MEKLRKYSLKGPLLCDLGHSPAPLGHSCEMGTVMWSHQLTGIMGKARESKGANVFPKIESALPRQGVVILVVIIIIMSKTVLPEGKRGPGPRESREVTGFTRRMRIKASRAVSYTHLTLPTTGSLCRSRWSPYH